MKEIKQWENKSLRDFIHLAARPITLNEQLIGVSETLKHHYIIQRSREVRKPIKITLMCQKMCKMVSEIVKLCKDRLNEPDILSSCV